MLGRQPVTVEIVSEACWHKYVPQLVLFPGSSHIFGIIVITMIPFVGAGPFTKHSPISTSSILTGVPTGWSYFIHFDLFIPRVLLQHELLSLSAMSQMRGLHCPRSHSSQRQVLSPRVLPRVPVSPQTWSPDSLECTSSSMQKEVFLSGIFVRIKDDVWEPPPQYLTPRTGSVQVTYGVNAVIILIIW